MYEMNYVLMIDRQH